MQARWTEEQHGDAWVVTVRGDLDLDSGPHLREHLAGALSRTDLPLLVDLSGVDFCDSNGLGALIATRRRTQLLGRRLRLRVARSGRLHRVLELSGLLDHFEIELVESQAS